MKEGRDFCLVNKINNHFFDLKEDPHIDFFKLIDTSIGGGGSHPFPFPEKEICVSTS